MTFDRKFFLREIRDTIILILIGILMTAVGLTCRNCIDTRKDFWVISSFTSLMWLLLWKGNSYLTDYISSKISWLKHPQLRFVVGVVTTFGYSYAAIYAAVFVYKNSLGYNFGRSGMTSFYSVLITLVISLFMHGRAFLTYWRQAAINAEVAKKESIAARYENLKSQVNPHFLFNSFNALANLVYEDQDKAVKFIKQLSEVYRYVLETRDKELVSLQEELKFLESYVFLQQIRFGNKLRIEIRLDHVKSMLAPLVLQMLAENAIKHNIVSEEHPLTIRMYADDQFIIIENNLQKKTVLQEESQGLGLENICKRYEFLSDRKVEIQRHDPFTVRLPRIDSVQ